MLKRCSFIASGLLLLLTGGVSTTVQGQVTGTGISPIVYGTGLTPADSNGQGQAPVTYQAYGFDDGSNGWSAYSIMNAIRHVSNMSNLVIVSAHRGVHAVWGNPNFTNTPENSLQSIYNAATNQTEVIELDVRLTQDGTPILAHDSTWGRNTNVGSNWGAKLFNPWGYLPGLTAPDGDPEGMDGGADSPSDPQAAVNPNVNGWRLDSVKYDNGGILLRNSQNFQWSQWNEHPPTLVEALDYVYANKWGVVLALDIKDNNAMQAAWSVVARNKDFHGVPYTSSVFFKFDASYIYPMPANFQAAFSGHDLGMSQPDYYYMNIMPVFQTSAIRPSGPYRNEGGVATAAATYLAQNYVVGVELHQKQYGGILTGTYSIVNNETSLGRYYNQGKAIAQFIPYAEWINPNDPSKTYQFFYSNGYCCAQLSNYFYNGAPNGQPSDTQDLRYDWNFAWTNNRGNTFLTTDNSQAFGYWLWQQGFRNTAAFK
jgi:glycerophosphoryl diester phosphodiesterase